MNADNTLTAIFMGTCQDVACGSDTIARVQYEVVKHDEDSGGIEKSITLHSLLVGSVGGGDITLSTQQEGLAMIGC